MSVLARFRGGGGTEHRVVALATAAARLMRAYSVQVETLRRLRHGGDQYVPCRAQRLEFRGQRQLIVTAEAGSKLRVGVPGVAPISMRRSRR